MDEKEQKKPDSENEQMPEDASEVDLWNACKLAEWVWDDENQNLENGSNNWWSKDNNSKFKITWGLSVSNRAFTPVSWWIASDNFTYSWYLNIGHKSWIGGTISRLDDFWNSAWSRFTKIWLTYNKNFGLSENWDICLKGDVSYVDFTNSFLVDGKELKLNELMWVVEVDFRNWEKYFFNLSFLYNAFLNDETPHNMIAKLKSGANLGKNTTLYSDWWLKVDVKGQKKVSLWLWVEQKLWKWFAAWLEGFYAIGDSRPKLLLGLRKDFKF